MPKRKGSAGGRAGGKRAATQGLANQALTSLVTLVTQGVMEALAEQGVGHGPSALDPSPPKFYCWRCGEVGHLARDCRNDIQCYRCEGWGHIARECATPKPSDLRDRLEEKRARRGNERARAKGEVKLEREQGETEQGGEGSKAVATAARVAVTSSSSSSSSSSSDEKDKAQTPDSKTVVAVTQKPKKAPLASMDEDELLA
jgi:hypothetical protein